MATAQMQRQLHTVAEYLELERKAQGRHEFLDGEIRSMAGESPQHSIINFDLNTALGNQLRGRKSCQGFSPNMKICSGKQASPRSRKGLFSYADLSVVCGEPQFHDDVGDVLINPSVIFEILSPSTESFDRGEKFQRFRTHNESLTDYVLISQTEPLIEHFARQANGQWLMTEIKGLESELYLSSIECRLKLAEIYARIAFQES